MALVHCAMRMGQSEECMHVRTLKVEVVQIVSWSVECHVSDHQTLSHSLLAVCVCLSEYSVSL